jgi:AraC family transcriptional regulator of adaptative response / DNA-3-methyladenine glycosylase II
MNDEHSSGRATPELDPEVCRRARLARDPRFDGEFFLGVSSTGIYCRPICPARLPAEQNVSYFRHAAQAASAGYRPCLRCRPESAPGSPAWLGSATTVGRALQLIREGALNEQPMAKLADRLGVGERYLRKLFVRELGVSPQSVARHQRLQFALKLLHETDLPLTEVAFAAGFGSIRRFNSAIREAYRRTPGDLRRRGGHEQAGGGVRLLLQYRPPYDWAGVLDFFGRHAIEGVETVADNSYRRNIQVDAQHGWFEVRDRPGQHGLQLTLHLPDPQQLMPLVARIRRMFDLDANPAVIAHTLAADPALAPLLDRFPGIRSPTQWSPFEAAVRAIVGQQVSVAAARTVCGRLAQAAAADGEAATFPRARDIGRLPDRHLPMPGRRRDCLRALCRTFSEREQHLDLSTLATLPGIGPWTRSLVAMRGFGDPDVFPSGDLGLVKAWSAARVRGNPGTLPTGTVPAESWRPWRSYAANLLWRSLQT